MADNGYQLLSHDDSKYSIAHPDGSTFDIAKSGLDDSTHSQILGLPAPNASPKADSPDAIAADAAALTTPPPNPDTTAIPTPEIPENIGPSLADTAAQFQANNPELVNTANAQPNTIPTNPNQGKISPTGPQDIMGIYGDVMKQQAEAAQGIAGAKTKEGAAQAQAYNNYVAQAQQADLEQKQAQADILAENDNLQKKITQGEDPNRYWNSRTMGQKVSATLAAILGGIGQGMQHSNHNVGLDMLNDNINKDIDAQKADRSAAQNLYSQNLAKYRDVGTATAATKLNLMNVMQAQLGKAAAQSGSKQAQFQAQATIAAMKAQQIPLMQQIAAAQVQARSLGAGGGEGGLPVGQEPLNMLSDPKYQEKRVVVGNKAFQAATGKDADELKNFQAEYEPIKNVVAQITALQGDPKALVPGSPENLKAQALRAYAVPRLNKMHGLSRLSEEDIHLMSDQLSDPTKFNQFLTGQTKNDTFLRNLDEDIESNYKTRIIGYKGQPTYSSFKPGK